MEWLVKLKLVSTALDTAVPLILDSRHAASQTADPVALFLRAKNQKQPKENRNPKQGDIIPCWNYVAGMNLGVCVC